MDRLSTPSPHPPSHPLKTVDIQMTNMSKGQVFFLKNKKKTLNPRFIFAKYTKLFHIVKKNWPYVNFCSFKIINNHPLEVELQMFVCFFGSDN